jgi:Ca2+-binding EF-hand superfamily protein
MITEERRGMTHMADIVETAARKVFERYDVDGDGLVTAEEYRQVVAELEGSELTEAQARELIDSLDTDGDRKMSFDEFWAAMHG